MIGTILTKVLILSYILNFFELLLAERIKTVQFATIARHQEDHAICIGELLLTPEHGSMYSNGL